MRLPFFNSKSASDKPTSITNNKTTQTADGSLSLMLPGTLQTEFVVYFRRPVPALPGEDDIKRLTRDWLQSHAGEPLRDLILQWLDMGLMQFHAAPSTEVPTPPLDFLRAFGLDQAMEQRLRQADSAIIVRSLDRLQYPCVGLWAALSTARSRAYAGRRSA